MWSSGDVERSDDGLKMTVDEGGRTEDEQKTREDDGERKKTTAERNNDGRTECTALN